jgi:hypothetical protein
MIREALIGSFFMSAIVLGFAYYAQRWNPYKIQVPVPGASKIGGQLAVEESITAPQTQVSGWKAMPIKMAGYYFKDKGIHPRNVRTGKRAKRSICHRYKKIGVI